MSNAELMKMMGPIGGFGLSSEYSKKDTAAKSIEDEDFNPKPYAIKATVAFVSYMILSNITYIRTRNYFESAPGLQQMQGYKQAYIDNHCVTNKGGQLQNMSVNGLFACSYVCFGYGAYIFTLYRLKILKRTSMPI